jgi:RNA polymerase sigma-70 factor, ECF subfamily
VALSPVDRDLLRRCFGKEPGSWNDFVDRFLSLIYHCIHYTAHLRSAPVTPEDVEDIAAEVLLQFVADDYKSLRQFRGKASLATYVTVIARRTCIHELNRRQTVRNDIRRGVSRIETEPADESEAAAKGVESLEEVERLLRKLSGKEREIVRLYYLQGWTYEEISTEVNVPVNSIGAILHRARKKLREHRERTKEITGLRPAAKGKDGALK